MVRRRHADHLAIDVVARDNGDETLVMGGSTPRAGATGESIASGPLVIQARLDVKPWGGRRLETFGIGLPPGEKIGEAVVTADDATVVTGAGTGRALGELIGAHPDWLGRRGREAVGGRRLFPLLVKLIDAAENLSIQVHPDDAAARPLDRLGKTEAWHVLAVEPGAVLYIGLRPGVALAPFAEACRRQDGSSATLLRTIPAKAGMTVLIPAGTVHALGAGVVVYEVQQPSDVTFRLDDWGRRDAEGRPRETHLAQGLDVARAELMPEPIRPVPLRSAHGRRHLLAACRYFALERIALTGGETVPVAATGSAQVVTLLSGEAVVRSEHGAAALAAGQSAAVWCAPERTWLEATRPVVALRAWVPEIAEEIAAPARRANVADDAIAALSGPVDDIQTALNVQR